MDADIQKFKGGAFKVLVESIRERFGEEGLQKVLWVSSTELRCEVRRKVMDHEWVPDHLGAELMERSDQLLGNGDGRVIRELGYMVAKKNLTGIYKVFVKFTSLRAIMKRSNVVWKKYYSHGWIEPIEDSDNHFLFEVVGYRPAKSTCLGILGWLDMFLEVYKKRGTVEHTQCKLRGDKKCIFDLKWQ